MSNFAQAMQIASGLRPRAIVADGRWRRCPTDDKPRKSNGAYILFPDGHGMYRNWAIDSGVQHWHDESAQPSPERAARIAARMAQLHQRERDSRRKAIQAARDLWAQGAPYRPHRYLTDKGLSAEGCANLRTWHGKV